MDKKETDVFDVIEGLRSVDPEALEDFEQAMTDKVIPEIVRTVEKRRMCAAESRELQLKD
jgi:hypothetical protein